MPVNALMFAKLLEGYDDKVHVVASLSDEFDLGFQGKQCSLSSNKSLTVSQTHPVAFEKVMSEVARGCIAGPFGVNPLFNLRCSPLSLREESTPGNFRLL